MSKKLAKNSLPPLVKFPGVKYIIGCDHWTVGDTEEFSYCIGYTKDDKLFIQQSGTVKNNIRNHPQGYWEEMVETLGKFYETKCLVEK